MMRCSSSSSPMSLNFATPPQTPSNSIVLPCPFPVVMSDSEKQNSWGVEQGASQNGASGSPQEKDGETTSKLDPRGLPLSPAAFRRSHGSSQLAAVAEIYGPRPGVHLVVPGSSQRFIDRTSCSPSSEENAFTCVDCRLKTNAELIMAHIDSCFHASLSVSPS